MTWSLVAINTLITVFLSFLPTIFANAIASQFAIVPAFISGSANPDSTELLIRPWLTLLTYGFIHVKWSHLASNMLVLWVFGDNIEKATGHIRFLLFYFLCQIAGGLTQVVSDPSSLVPSIGASAAVSSIVGGYLLVRPQARVVMLVLGVMTVNFRAYWVIAGWMIWQLAEYLIYQADSNVAYWGHFGGFVTGALLIVLLRRPDVKIFGRPGPRSALRSGFTSTRRRLNRLKSAIRAFLSRQKK